MDTRSSTTTNVADAQRIDWLRLIRSDNVGPRTFRSLVNHFGSARAALERLPDLARRGGASRPARICSEEEARAELAASERLGVHLVSPYDMHTSLEAPLLQRIPFSESIVVPRHSGSRKWKAI